MSIYAAPSTQDVPLEMEAVRMTGLGLERDNLDKILGLNLV